MDTLTVIEIVAVAWTVMAMFCFFRLCLPELREVIIKKQYICYVGDRDKAPEPTLTMVGIAIVINIVWFLFLSIVWPWPFIKIVNHRRRQRRRRCWVDLEIDD